jgi:hypothetical protein
LHAGRFEPQGKQSRVEKIMDTAETLIAGLKNALTGAIIGVQQMERERDEMVDAGHALGLLALQSDRYHSDPDFRDATDAMLDLVRKAGKL